MYSRQKRSPTGWLVSRVARGTRLMADEAGIMEPAARALRSLPDRPRQGLRRWRCPHKRGLNHFSSRLRRGERGHFHSISGPYLANYARESAWREDNRRVSNGDQTQHAAKLAMTNGPSPDFCGYWQRHLKLGPETDASDPVSLSWGCHTHQGANAMSC